MDPRDIARFISEDISTNNGFIFEGLKEFSLGPSYDGSDWAKRLLSVIEVVVETINNKKYDDDMDFKAELKTYRNKFDVTIAVLTPEGWEDIKGKILPRLVPSGESVRPTYIDAPRMVCEGEFREQYCSGYFNKPFVEEGAICHKCGISHGHDCFIVDGVSEEGQITLPKALYTFTPNGFGVKLMRTLETYIKELRSLE